MQVVREEIFGPVLSTQVFEDDSLEQLAARGNDTVYGLSSSIWTRDLARAHRLVKRIRAGGLTVLIVEQNVQQVLQVVDRAYLLEAGSIRTSGTSAELLASDTIRQAYLGV